MVYNPATDFLALWRASGGNVSKMELPGLDYVLSALARAGIINLAVAATAPVVNQSTTAWLRTAVPSWSAEGSFFLWDKVTSAYLAATPKLFLQFLEACASESGVSWYATTGGAPLNTVGNDGDFAIRTDGIGGIYGPKAAGAWPASPLPGTTNEINQTALDTTFGSAPGSLIVRGPATWDPLPIGGDGSILAVAAGAPSWDALSALLDVAFGTVRGSILYRGAGAWNDLPPGVANQVLSTAGPGADPAWANRTAEFPSGTRMVFHQTAAPVGWTKDVTINDYGMRIVAGAAGTTVGSPFSTVFAQNATGGHALSIAEMPAHHHDYSIPIAGPQKPNSGGTSPLDPTFVAAQTSDTGGNVAHTHPVNLTLAYTDVIIAQKD